MKNLLIVIVVCLVVWGVVYEYRQRRVDHVLSSGDTISPDGSAPSSSSPSASDIPPQSAPQAAEPQPQPEPQAPRQAPAPSPAAASTQTPAPAQAAAVPAPDPRPTRVSSAADTISPNPPNGTPFTGTGKFQVYRQGNLTWRLNTDTGQTCILFATDAEWRKPRVYERGCAQS